MKGQLIQPWALCHLMKRESDLTTREAQRFLTGAEVGQQTASVGLQKKKRLAVRLAVAKLWLWTVTHTHTHTHTHVYMLLLLLLILLVLVAPTCFVPIIFFKRNYLGIVAPIQVPFQATWLICVCPPPLTHGST